MTEMASKCGSIERIDKGTVYLENTDHRCINCEFYEPWDNFYDRGDYCSKRHYIEEQNPDEYVCREWR